LLEAPESPKKLTKEESLGWRERMKEYEKRAHEGRMALKDQKHPEFPEEKIKIGSRDFDKEVHSEYRRYLLAIPEELVLSLPVSYAYARVRFLGEIETARYLESVGYNPNPQVDTKEAPRGYGGPKKAYKDWTGD